MLDSVAIVATLLAKAAIDTYSKSLLQHKLPAAVTPHVSTSSASSLKGAKVRAASKSHFQVQKDGKVILVPVNEPPAVPSTSVRRSRKTLASAVALNSSKANTKPKRKSVNAAKPAKSQSTVSTHPSLTQEIYNQVVEQFKKDIPGIVSEYIQQTSTSEIIHKLDSVHLEQIALAQEFLNENSQADLSHIQCLLRKMYPKQYHDVIDALKQHQDPQVIINIHGGQNVIAPHAKDVEQKNS